MRRYRIYRVNAPGTVKKELFLWRHFDYANDAIDRARKFLAEEPDQRIQIEREDDNAPVEVFWRSWEET